MRQGRMAELHTIRRLEAEMFTTVLVTNPGEIAVRAFRAAYELGAGTVHRLKADESDLLVVFG